AWDIDPTAARAFAVRMEAVSGLAVETVVGLQEATRLSDVIVTCTPARVPFLGLDDVPAGCFVAAVGADNPAKSEIKPDLMANATGGVDVLEQGGVQGGLHHPVPGRAGRGGAAMARTGAGRAGPP